jgi:molybdenum cofactor cytidylyltransferase
VRVWGSAGPASHPESRLIPMDRVAAVIIAAGSSSRLGQPKQLLMLNGETLLERAIRTADESGAAPVFVVLGANRIEIESHANLSKATLAFNSDWKEGMASSIRAGIRALEEQAPETLGVLLMICDQPAVTSDHLREVLATFRENPACAIASVYASKRGIPAIFPRKSFGDLLALRGDQGARGLLSGSALSVIEIPLERGELDIDLPEDLSHLRTS